jgi:hypothetical protein
MALLTSNTQNDLPKVGVVQSKYPVVAHVEVVAHHGNHVKHYEAHDYHIKLFVCDDSKYDCLRFPGWPWQCLRWFLASSFFHSSNIFLLICGHESVQGRATLVLLLIEFINDDANKEVESEKASKDDEDHKVDVEVKAVFKAWLVVQLKEKKNLISRQ